MNMENIKKEVLNYLFNEYSNTSDTSLYGISHIAHTHNLDVHELGRYLLGRGWIKNQRFLPQEFQCSITMAGIQEIAPNYLEGNGSKIIDTLGINGGTMDLMEVLDYPPQRYQSARDIANVLKGLDLIDVFYTAGSGNIKLTLAGQALYSKGKGGFLHL